MSTTILKNARMACADDVRDIRVEGQFIQTLHTVSEIPDVPVVICTDLTLYPGFLDVHNHGAVGVDVNEAELDGLVTVGEFLARSGVTAWVPTLVPDSDEDYARVIGEIDRLMEIQEGMPIAQVVGVHYEGVFANDKMCGALRPQFFKRFTGGEVGSLPLLKRGV